MSIAIFASGSGSNFESIVSRSREENWPAEVSLVITDRGDAKVIERAERLQVPHHYFAPQSFPNKEAYEAEILNLLKANNIKLIVLAGYMRLIGETLLTAYKDKIINIHPSLLPAFAGKDAILRAFEYPVKVSGVTVHYVDEGMDTGPIIAQVPVNIDAEDTLDSFTKKIQAIEHKLYPDVVYQLISRRKSFA